MKKFIFTLVCVLWGGLFVWGQTLSSPNGALQLSFRLSKEGTPTYALTFKGQTVIGESPLGFVINQKEDFSSDFETVSVQYTETNTVWQPVLGENKDIRDHHKELLVH